MASYRVYIWFAEIGRDFPYGFSSVPIAWRTGRLSAGRARYGNSQFVFA